MHIWKSEPFYKYLIYVYELKVSKQRYSYVADKQTDNRFDITSLPFASLSFCNKVFYSGTVIKK